MEHIANIHNNTIQLLHQQLITLPISKYTLLFTANTHNSQINAFRKPSHGLVMVIPIESPALSTNLIHTLCYLSTSIIIPHDQSIRTQINTILQSYGIILSWEQYPNYQIANQPPISISPQDIITLNQLQITSVDHISRIKCTNASNIITSLLNNVPLTQHILQQYSLLFHQLCPQPKIITQSNYFHQIISTMPSFQQSIETFFNHQYPHNQSSYQQHLQQQPIQIRQQFFKSLAASLSRNQHQQYLTKSIIQYIYQIQSKHHSKQLKQAQQQYQKDKDILYAKLNHTQATILQLKQIINSYKATQQKQKQQMLDQSIPNHQFTLAKINSCSSMNKYYNSQTKLVKSQSKNIITNNKTHNNSQITKEQSKDIKDKNIPSKNTSKKQLNTKIKINQSTNKLVDKQNKKN